jgi:hypothetical protein
MSECWQGVNNVIPEFQAAKCIWPRIVAKDNLYLMRALEIMSPCAVHIVLQVC